MLIRSEFPDIPGPESQQHCDPGTIVSVKNVQPPASVTESQLSPDGVRILALSSGWSQASIVLVMIILIIDVFLQVSASDGQ